MKRYYICKIIGDGLTPETSFRPAIEDVLDAINSSTADRPVVDSDNGRLDSKDGRENIKLVGELLQEVPVKNAKTTEIEFPQAEESEGFDEEAAVIMLLLAA